jgi:hypothetical protein
VSECEHDWYTGPVVNLRFAMQAVCIRCWGLSTLPYVLAKDLPKWTEELYWEHLDVLEGERADEIRAMKGST